MDTGDQIVTFSLFNAKLARRCRNSQKEFFRPQLESLEELCLLSAGSLDPTFGTGGEVFTDFTQDRQVSREVLQPDGKIVVAGSMTRYNGFSVARYNADGSPDLAFGQSGVVLVNFANDNYPDAFAVALQSDGKIVVVGRAFNSITGSDFALARFNSDGTLDATFGSGGQVTTDLGGGHDYATSVVIQSDGKIVVAGGGGIDTKNEYAIARYNPDGTLDASFGDGGKVLADFPNGDPIVTDRFLALQADGKILVAGNDTPDANQDILVARFNQDGTPDPTFGTSGVALIAFKDNSAQYTFAQAESLIVQGDSKIVVVGTVEATIDPYGNQSPVFGGYSAIALARLNPDGTLDSTFGTAGETTTIFGSLGGGAYGAVLQPDGAIVVLGNVDAPNDFNLALVRYTANGQLDPTFGNGGPALTPFSGEEYYAQDIVREPDGKFLVIANNHGYQKHLNYVLAQFLGGANWVPGPLLSATGIPVITAEAQPFSGQVATFSVPDSTAAPGDFTATIDWGDISSSPGTIIQPGGPGTAFYVTGDHVWADESIHFFRVAITAKTGDIFFATAQFTINDAPLMATGIPVTASAGVSFSGPVATITDANPNGNGGDFYFSPPGTFGILAWPHYWIDWGDGTTSLATLTGGMGAPFVMSGSHTYLVAGSYTIKATIEDYGGSSATATATATVAKTSHIVGRALQNGQIWTGASTGSSFNSSMWAALDPSVTWVDPVVGDFNGDGLADIAARDANTGKWWVGLSNGSGFTMSMWNIWSTGVTWADVQVGDFNGDGKADIVGRYAEGGDWWVALSNGSGFTDAKWNTWSTGVKWADVKVGDFNGDGKADITGRYLQGGTWWTGISTGSSFTTTMWATWSTSVTWVDVQVGDFNGDGMADITGRALETGDWWTSTSYGTSFLTWPRPWATWSTSVTWVDVHVGDFSGEGVSDIVGRALQTGDWWIGHSNQLPQPPGLPPGEIVGEPVPPAFLTNLWSTWSTSVNWVDVQVGDFNGDGKSDIVGRALETGDWWRTGLVNGGGLETTKWGTWSTGVTWTGVHAGDFA
jgi:uncharacterized delta-60 repeat protein